MVFTKASGGEEHREAHDVEVLLTVVQGILANAQDLVLLDVGFARELAVQASDGVGLKAGDVFIAGFLQHGAGGTVGNLYYPFGYFVDEVDVNIPVEPVDVSEGFHGNPDQVDVDEATPDYVTLGWPAVDYNVQLRVG